MNRVWVHSLDVVQSKDIKSAELVEMELKHKHEIIDLFENKY